MAKWYGKIGFTDSVELEPGLWTDDTIVEKTYSGDVYSIHWKRQTVSDKINSDINLSNQISIVADPYAVNHCSSMVYIEYMNEKWKISDVEVQYPRLLLTIGGVYK